MKKVVIAFDVDGTLRCNCTEACQDTNLRVVLGLAFFNRLKNSRIMIWSGGGAEYARNFVMTAIRRGEFGPYPSMYTRGVHYASKLDETTWKWGKPDIAIDDIQDFEMGTFNLIVRVK